jgi:hypothetical protein
MSRIRSELSLDASFRLRRARPVVSSVLALVVAAAFARKDGTGGLFYFETAVIFGVVLVVMTVITGRNLMSDEPGAGPGLGFTLRALFTPRDALAPRRFTGRVIVREAVTDPRTAGRVGAYFHAEPSPREQPWSPLLRLVPRLHAYVTLPADSIRADAGVLDIVLADGRLARVVTDAVELLDRRRFALLESRHVVLREGDLVEVRGVAAFSELEGAYLFEGALASRVTLCLLERPRASAASATA